ncbi:hypothetical protein [Agrobacterium tumefaciens]|uniref:hypothetical protein n=1 Tax=Agrobacterium tumefaciens TaxID=358 RepID=UPI00287E0957|nr:hypothetical protein [Agrobacterium tumefaciens]MDS7596771.1 hypothetical protein [Agrobacterium tumefaciens]
MVSSIDLSTRLTATKLALKAIKEQEDTTESASNQRTQLLSSYGIDTTASTSTTLNNLLTRLAQQAGETTDTDEAAKPISSDITSADFMAGLKKKIESLAEDPTMAVQAKEMLAALEKGTLTVSDPLNGVQMTAWDPSDEDDVTTQAKTQIETMGWSEFLKQRLEREAGSYVRSSTGAYTDTVSGANAFFGSVGDRYYYLTWPKADTNTVTV